MTNLAAAKMQLTPLEEEMRARIDRDPDRDAFIMLMMQPIEVTKRIHGNLQLRSQQALTRLFQSCTTSNDTTGWLSTYYRGESGKHAMVSEKVNAFKATHLFC